MRTPSSLKVLLIRNLMLLLTFSWLATLGVGYFLAQKTFNQQLDMQLEQVASSLSKVVTTSLTTIEIRKNRNSISQENNAIEFQILQNERRIGYSENAPREILSQSEGFSQSEIANKLWRVFSARAGDSRIVVGQDLNVRKSLIQDLILSNLWPMLIALPIIALTLWISVTVALRPLSVLAFAIKKRSPEQLTPIDLHQVPIEITPVVQSLNDLLGVVGKALEREKQFTDNAAHELRTPLAAIKTQAQLALRSTNEQEKNESILAVDQGVDRAAKMVSQLLTLSRLDPENLNLSFSSVNLSVLTAQVIAKLVPQALLKKIDIGLEESEQVTVEADASYLEMLISNLVDNAIRYSPQNGLVDVRIQKTDFTAILIIEDNGPGIPEKDRERVFDRFVRLSGGLADGSGIGLAIVKKIASLHHAKVDLDSPEGHPGLTVRVILKRSPSC